MIITRELEKAIQDFATLLWDAGIRPGPKPEPHQVAKTQEKL